ncbi:hypothetical protein NM688_g3063 [Phlebia brevispora]|uniref:Uncharacterized protein n=1 Tax=Phlebia brevispora TaxID=194682 RepID=A0ACC1T708_9APHY|nr:hypothetical protein NM688_g3063 [Phlebia brevispora]
MLNAHTMLPPNGYHDKDINAGNEDELAGIGLPTPHHDLWFSDGSIVLQAERTLFRVHISWLSRHSMVFRDMFSMPQPAPVERSQDIPSDFVPDGCQYMRLDDTAEDLANLLTAIYDGPSFGNNDRADFQILSGVLRLSTKYAVDDLRRKTIEHLSVAWPSTLKGWDAREEAARTSEAESAIPRRQRYPSPIAVINLARKVDAPSLLAAAFYELSRYHFSEIFGPGQHAALRSDTEVLSPTDLQRLALGKEGSQQAIPALIQSMGLHSQREHTLYSCHGTARIPAHHRRRSSGQVCTSAAACRQDLAELVELATQHYLFDRGKGCTDPLYVAEELGQLKSAELNDCQACARSLEAWASKEREKIWKLIPGWFHLEYEDVLRHSEVVDSMRDAHSHSGPRNRMLDTRAQSCLARVSRVATTLFLKIFQVQHAYNMSPVHALDRYYLAVTLLVTVGYQGLGFLIAWTCQFDKITDFTGGLSVFWFLSLIWKLASSTDRRGLPGSNFFLLALLTLLMGNTFYARNIVASVFVMIWATRLAGQIIWVWTVSLPVVILNSPAVSDRRLRGTNPAFGTAGDIVGIVLWVLGWSIESTADLQKYIYKTSNPPKDRAVNIGLWSWCRHPPYFGEILCWWGIWALCLSPSIDSALPSSAKAAQRGSVISPFFTMVLLLFASGIPTAEKPTARRFFLLSHGSEDPEYPDAWVHYKEYLNSTSLLIPLPPFVYRRLPMWLKRSVLFDWPIYRFNEETDGKQAIEESHEGQLGA